MKVYFIPFACSLALRIAAEEAGLTAEFVRVTPDGCLPDGRAVTELSPFGYVPIVELEDGTILREGVATLAWLAEQAPAGVLEPDLPDLPEARAELIAWLTFVATELHKGIFHLLMAKDTNDGARAVAMALVPSRFGYLDRVLAGRSTLLDGFSVADAYLLAVLNWCEHAGIDATAYPHLLAWRAAMRTRPSVARAMAAELPLLGGV